MEFDFEAEITGISDQEAFLVTDSEPPDKASVRVRYRGFVLGGRPNTTCNFEWDGSFISLASFEVDDAGTVFIRPEDY
jgi:hypothetical protein